MFIITFYMGILSLCGGKRHPDGLAIYYTDRLRISSRIYLSLSVHPSVRLAFVYSLTCFGDKDECY